MRAYSTDLRVRVPEAAGGGETTADLAGRFAASPAWVRRRRQRHRQTGAVGPRAGRPARAREPQPHHPRIRDLLAATPGLTLAELRAEPKVAVALSAPWAAGRPLGYTFRESRPGGRAGPAGRP